MVGNQKRSFPGSVQRRSAEDMAEVANIAEAIAEDGAKTIDVDDFRVQGGKPEVERRHDRLREAVRRAGGNKAVASKSGVPISTLGVYLSGGEWKITPALALAEACGVSLDWLATGTTDDNPPPVTTSVLEPPDQNVELQKSLVHGTYNYEIIPSYEIRRHSGDTDLQQDKRLAGVLALETSFVGQVLRRNHKDLVTISATGDSMEPTVHDGDILIVDTRVKDVENSRVYVLQVKQSTVVKRLSLRLDGTIEVRSDNPKYPTEDVPPANQAHLNIIGQVVYQAGPVRP